MPAYKLGGNAKLYIGATGVARVTWPTSGAAAGLVLVNRVGDLKMPIDFAKLDATTRDTPGWEAFFAGLAAAAVDFQLKYDPTDTTYQTLRTLAFNSTRPTIPLAILDGGSTTVGTEGCWFDAQIFKWEKGEPVKELQVVDVTMAPSLASGTSQISPQWIVVGTGPVSV